MKRNEQMKREKETKWDKSELIQHEIRMFYNCKSKYEKGYKNEKNGNKKVYQKTLLQMIKLCHQNNIIFEF